MKRKIIAIDESLCDGCGDCVTSCAEGAIKIIDGKAKLVSDSYCDGLGDCIGHCPRGALKIIEREAAPFDEEIFLKTKTASSACKSLSQNINMQAAKLTSPVCNCPSQNINMKATKLNNWPIQLSLVPEDAGFFHNKDLLIAADCTAFSYPNYQNEILQNKILLIACPKLDNREQHLGKLIKIFSKNAIESITVLRMQVPCCSQLSAIVQMALEMASKKIDLKEIIVQNNGTLLR